MKLDIKYLVPGMELVADVYPEHNPNVYLLGRGKVLTSKDITSLRQKGITTVDVRIDDYSQTFNDVFQEMVKETIANHKLEAIKDIALKYKEIADMTEDYRIDMKKYLTHDMNPKQHGVNTVNMAIALAGTYNRIVGKSDQIPIERMAEAAMLQDIGRLAKDERVLISLDSRYSNFVKKLRQKYPNIPEDILENYRSEYHALYSYLLVKDSNLESSVTRAILFHHEREKGTKGPIGVELSTLSEDGLSTKMSMILKLCDMYDILLYQGKERVPEMPFKEIPQAIDKMVANGFVNPYWANMIKMVVPVYPNGVRVELSDGTIGIVYSQNSNDMLRPVVRDLKHNIIELGVDGLEITSLCLEEEPIRENKLA